MAFKIATNVASLNTQRWLGVAGAGMSKSLEKLSSGFKINKAADDAAGIAIALKLNVKAASVSKAIDSGNQAIAMLQTAETGVEQIANILTRLKELAVQSASDNNSTDRSALDAERGVLEGEIDKIAGNTKYGTTALLTGGNTYVDTDAGLTAAVGIARIDVSSSTAGAYEVTVSGNDMSIANGGVTQTITFIDPAQGETHSLSFSSFGITIDINAAIADVAANTLTVTAGSSSFAFQLGADNSVNDQITVAIGNFTAAGATLTLSGDISGRTNAQTYMDTVDTAVAALNTQRAAIGAAQNQIGYHVANLNGMYENTKAAESTIKDADFAKEMADFTKFQIMNQSGVAMLAQANQLPQMILSLMK